jgi:hypothetical protein
LGLITHVNRQPCTATLQAANCWYARAAAPTPAHPHNSHPPTLPACLQEVSCSLNFDSHTGRGKVALANPRYSGLRGDSLSGGFRWEQDVVRLERLVLQQQRSRYKGWCAAHVGVCVGVGVCWGGGRGGRASGRGGEVLALEWACLAPLMNAPLHVWCQVAPCKPTMCTPLPCNPATRYEVQGEYGLPPNLPLPKSAADLATAAGDSATAATGRWRVQVSVPWAELQEIVPVARLLQSATSLSPAEYERAKAAFLQVFACAGVGWMQVTCPGILPETCGCLFWMRPPTTSDTHMPTPLLA